MEKNKLTYSSTSSNPYTEEELIERILDGEKALYELIVRRYNPQLYKIGRSYNYNHADTQDLMQETFIDSFKNLKQFEGRSTFKTWIVRIMLNNCYRKKNKSSYKNEIMRDFEENAAPLFSNPDNRTDRVVRNHELKDIIENALTQLPSDYRIIFSLREINGFNVKETADLLEISESNVKTRLSRAKSMLQDNLSNEYSPQELFDFNLIYCDGIVEYVMKRIYELE